MKKTITFLLVALFTGFTSFLSAQTVNIDGNPYGGNPYGTIQLAVNAAADGDVILITGVHTVASQVNLGAKGITLRGTDPTMDIIQANAAPLTATYRVLTMSTSPLNVTIENLGIRNGNVNATGGTNGGAGINIDKMTGLVTLKNLIIQDNKTLANGGGINAAGSNVDIIGCTIKGNTSGQDGGAIIASSNNGSLANSVVNIKQSLINGNTGRNGGAIFINGNTTFGNSYKIDVNVENSTISNNTSNIGTGFSGATFGGGGIYVNPVTLVGSSPVIGNTALKLIHATVYGNICTNYPSRAGIHFGGVSTAVCPTSVSAYNSIIVSKDDLNEKAITLINYMTLTDMKNCIIGGLNGTVSEAGYIAALAVIDDGAKNNQKAKTATDAGLSGMLTDEGGNTQVLALGSGTLAVDFCTVAPGVTVPTVDQRGAAKSGTYDAGAYELGGTLSIGDINAENKSVQVSPNPTKGVVKISGVDSVDSVSVYSILGTLEKVIVNQSEFDLSGLSNGVHILVIESEGQKIVKRVIIK